MPDGLTPELREYLDTLVPEWRTLTVEEIRERAQQRARELQDELLDLVNEEDHS